MARLTLHPLRLDFPCPVEADPVGALLRQLDGTGSPGLPAPGSAVAILVGSRKIANLPHIVSALASWLKGRGLRPFVVPAMGSHGGATGEGQREILKAVGITEDSVGVPIACGGRVVSAGRTVRGLEVWADEAALSAAAMIPVNRVKPHTAFRGEVESGPSKMLAVGLGRERSATALHRAGLARSIPEAAGLLLATGKIPFGVALLENHRGETARVAVLPKEGWLDAEAALLREAWALYPRLPWRELDLLVVERIGKDISGTGMDLNVIGMGRRFPGVRAFPVIGRIVALSLTPASLGNATGVGYADIVTKELADAVDVAATEFNCAASGFPEAARLPRIAGSEEEAVEWALEDLGNPSPFRAVRVRDTSSLSELLVTSALLGDGGEAVDNSWGEAVDNPVGNGKTL